MIFFHNTPLSTSIPQPFHRKTAVVHVFSAEPKRFSTIPIVETVENLPWSLDGEYAASTPVIDIVNRQRSLTMLL